LALRGRPESGYLPRMIAHTCTQCGAAIDVAQASAALDLRCRYCGASVVLPGMAERHREREERDHLVALEKQRLDHAAQIERERMAEQRVAQQAATRRRWVGLVVGVALAVFVVGASIVGAIGTGVVASLQASQTKASVAAPMAVRAPAAPAAVAPAAPVARAPSSSSPSASAKTSGRSVTTTTSDGATVMTDGNTTTVRAPSSPIRATPPKRRAR
jgi:predicted  nucleic acid-binding Zn-ribbon protein